MERAESVRRRQSAGRHHQSGHIADQVAAPLDPPVGTGTARYPVPGHGSAIHVLFKPIPKSEAR